MLKYLFNYETWYYPPLNNAKHLQLFGRGIHTSGINRRKAAYKRACALRDFEITYFWRRSKYFWGFISIVLGAYTAMSVSEFRSEIAELHLDFCLLIVGLLFTIIWLLVLLGSKAWYEHWEYMICFLEDAIRRHSYPKFILIL